MIPYLKEEWLPKRQLPLFWGFTVTWVCCVLFLLYTGGQLAFISLSIISLLALYLILMGKWSGIAHIYGTRKSTDQYHKGRVEAGSPLNVSMSLTIPGILPITHVNIKDHLVQLGQNSDTKNYFMHETSFVPHANRSGQVEYSIPDMRRGSYQFKSTECSTTDIFGLFEHKKELNLSSTFKVYPAMAPISNWLLIQTMKKGSFHQSSSSPFYKRETTQINGTREYTHGDRLSRIHWNATAKTGVMKSKEFERETLPKTLLVLDRYKGSSQEDDSFELAVSVTASILHYCAKQRLPVGLISLGIQSHYFDPREGQAHLNKMEEHLIHTTNDGALPLHQHLRGQLNVLPGTLMIVVTSQFSNELLQSLRWMKQLGLHPYHLWISNQKNVESGRWAGLLRSEMMQCYQIPSLSELPFVLGGNSS